MVPYADFNLLKFPDRDQAMEKILDLTMLSDIFPTGYHGAVHRRAWAPDPRSTSPAPGPVGLAAATRAQLLGAAVVIVGDMNADRLEQARKLRLRDHRPLQGRHPGGPDRADPRRAGGGLRGGRRRASRPTGHGAGAGEAPATVLNSLMDDHRAPAASLASPGCTSPATRAASTRPRKKGTARCSLGLGWAKSLSFTTGQCPVMKYNRGLMMGILHDKVHIAKAVNATVIPLDDAPRGYSEFDEGAARSTCSTRTA